MVNMGTNNGETGLKQPLTVKTVFLPHRGRSLLNLGILVITSSKCGEGSQMTYNRRNMDEGDQLTFLDT